MPISRVEGFSAINIVACCLGRTTVFHVGVARHGVGGGGRAETSSVLCKQFDQAINISCGWMSAEPSAQACRRRL